MTKGKKVEVSYNQFLLDLFFICLLAIQISIGVWVIILKLVG